MGKDNLLGNDIEVFHEVASGVWADFTRYANDHNIPDDDPGPFMAITSQVFKLWQERGTIATREDLDKSWGGLEFARACLKALQEADKNGQSA